jgi:hypothetical protein
MHSRTRWPRRDGRSSAASPRSPFDIGSDVFVIDPVVFGVSDILFLEMDEGAPSVMILRDR